MNGRELWKGLGQVDEDLVAQAAEAGRRRPLRYLAAAACICVLLAGAALAAQSVWDLRLRDRGYEVAGQWEAFPVEVFSAQARALARQAEDPPRLRSAAFRTFDTWDACGDFLAFPLPNPLEGAEELEASEVELVSPEVLSAHCLLTLKSFRDQLAGAAVTAAYRSGDLDVTLTADIQTEYGVYRETGVRYPGERAVDLSADTYVLPDGGEAAVAASTWPDLTAYFLRDGVGYTLRITAPEGREAAARELLEDLLDRF